uniref:Protein phosphatase 1 regulatory subunit 12A n=1 Tax=Schistosoma haematobium TaxID=6185 RepID=A0A094ZS81_SCHHA
MIQLKLSDSDICERRKAQLKEWCGSETDHASSKMREPEKIKFPLSVQLLAACSNSDLDEFSRLLKLGTDINTQNADGLTSTHLACINVDFDFLKFLIRNGADINLQDHEGWTPLHAAASVGCCELARFFLLTVDALIHKLV